jgi:hypothetical protein
MLSLVNQNIITREHLIFKIQENQHIHEFIFNYIETQCIHYVSNSNGVFINLDCISDNIIVELNNVVEEYIIKYQYLKEIDNEEEDDFHNNNNNLLTNSLNTNCEQLSQMKLNSHSELPPNMKYSNMTNDQNISNYLSEHEYQPNDIINSDIIQTISKKIRKK